MLYLRTPKKAKCVVPGHLAGEWQDHKSNTRCLAPESPLACSYAFLLEAVVGLKFEILQLRLRELCLGLETNL